MDDLGRGWSSEAFFWLKSPKKKTPRWQSHWGRGEGAGGGIKEEAGTDRERRKEGRWSRKSQNRHTLFKSSESPIPQGCTRSPSCLVVGGSSLGGVWVQHNAEVGPEGHQLRLQPSMLPTAGI